MSCISSIYIYITIFSYYPRANGAKRRSGRKPGARVTNLALAIGKLKVSICDREYGWSSSLISNYSGLLIS